MVMVKCERCGSIVPSMQLFRFDRDIYKWASVHACTKTVMKDFNGKGLCPVCRKEMVDKIKQDDYDIRRVEHLDTPDAFIKGFNFEGFKVESSNQSE